VANGKQVLQGLLQQLHQMCRVHVEVIDSRAFPVRTLPRSSNTSGDNRRYHFLRQAL
jgi:hypothetical protein